MAERKIEDAVARTLTTVRNVQIVPIQAGETFVSTEVEIVDHHLGRTNDLVMETAFSFDGGLSYQVASTTTKEGAKANAGQTQIWMQRGLPIPPGATHIRNRCWCTADIITARMRTRVSDTNIAPDLAAETR